MRNAADLLVIPMGSEIPRIIHQTFPTTDLPPDIAENVRRLKEQNPTFEHKLYDDSAIEDYISEHYGRSMLDLYNKISPAYGAARADLFRYLLIYRSGGVYLDIKSTITSPLELSLKDDDRFLLSYWDNGPGSSFEGWGTELPKDQFPRGEFQQWHIIAAPGHPFMRAVILRVIENIRNYTPWRNGVGRLGTLRTTGPICYTLAIQPILGDHPTRVLENESEAGLKYSIYDDKMGHRTLSKSYYRRNTGAVINRGPAWSIAFAFYTNARRIVRRASR